MDVSRLSGRFFVQKLAEDDARTVYELCRKNPLYYRYCPPFVTEESILRDMRALPPRTAPSDKFYLGYYDGSRLIAVLDLILGYPAGEAAFIGFFMTDPAVQIQGIGSAIVGELCQALKKAGFAEVRLGWVKGNPQAEHFWRKNGFRETGITYETGDEVPYTVTVARKSL